MNLSALRNKKILIVGYGIEGKATRDFLRKKFPKMRVGITDAKKGADYLKKQKDYDLAIRSPGTHPKQLTIPYTTATNIFFASSKRPIIGITGSKGKSTTSALVASILKHGGFDARLVGNIGYPMLTELLRPVKKNTVYVCELSSFQTMDLHCSPHISVILNLYEEHLDFHGTRSVYWQAKERMVLHAISGDYFVYDPLYPRLAKLARNTKAKAVPIIKTLPFALGPTHLKGKHNEANIRAAYTIAHIMGVSDKHAAHAIETFKPLPHRLEPIGTYHGIQFYNDSIATIPEAAMYAVEALGARVQTLILGGFDRGIDFSRLAKFIARRTHIKTLILFAPSGKRMQTSLHRIAKRTPQKEYFAKDMREAVTIAFRETTPGHVALLSPASPSFGLFRDYQDRGKQFASWAKRLGKKRS
ncbi:MAG: hypothetical protein A3C84_00300 [Candidatus Ryanbacteria bacterium RIFCSPHIGHO2_02_FULL_48_12]|uniref:UDP-N-acetylmuramoylalanine--D-glutamate ligase n=1 Tax=Candidatus Ryanbacteria bacterium RIFCSPHIGHO2_01_FULL_48_27 TaxID=1802115 RepID=A0A1G2G5A1_9BACT|nr:MAG: hypothetical protein A2756_00140 [Candidatus Ryanbacteria bacterium RIFCSPHIGHO2_01_FULL_48_27]OGZ50417.1 MAG: hypothetical protein A3C84_00300 [Candidatus Ryanbacteria bacterium RIFCSPHIGHO2_02_FULL_48_12]